MNCKFWTLSKVVCLQSLETNGGLVTDVLYQKHIWRMHDLTKLNRLNQVIKLILSIQLFPKRIRKQLVMSCLMCKFNFHFLICRSTVVDNMTTKQSKLDCPKGCFPLFAFHLSHCWLTGDSLLLAASGYHWTSSVLTGIRWIVLGMTFNYFWQNSREVLLEPFWTLSSVPTEESPNSLEFKECDPITIQTLFKLSGP